MTTSLQIKLVEPVLRAAVLAGEAMTTAQRADIYEGIAHIARRIDLKLSTQARDCAKALRDADALQLHFRNLFAPE